MPPKLAPVFEETPIAEPRASKTFIISNVKITITTSTNLVLIKLKWKWTGMTKCGSEKGRKPSGTVVTPNGRPINVHAAML